MPSIALSSIPTLGPYPAFMTSSPYFPPLLSTLQTSTPPLEATYITAYRFAATMAGCTTVTPQEKQAIVKWLRELALELHETLLESLAIAMPEGKTPGPKYEQYRRVPETGGKEDVAVVDLYEHKGRTLRAVNFTHIARLKEIGVLEDLVMYCK